MRAENYTEKIKELEQYWLIKENNGMLLKDASRDSKCKYYWKCKNNKHIVYRAIHNFIKHECNYCTGREIWSGENDLETLYPEIAKQWDQELNSDLESNPSNLSPGSKKAFYWRCSEGHIRERSVFLEIRYKGRCPKCKGMEGKNGVLLKDSRPDLKNIWSPNNSIDFDEISAQSGQTVEWLCENNINAHNYRKKVNHQYSKTKKYCPYCEHDLEDLENSAYSLPFIDMWIDDSNPKAYTKHTRKVINWKCWRGHEFKKQIKTMTSKNGYCCPECRIIDNSDGESYLKRYFNDKNIVFEANKRILDGLEIDLYFKDLNKGIEFNGEHWHSDEMIKDKSNGRFINGNDYHQNKLNIAKDKNIDLAFVWAHDLSKHSEILLKEVDDWMSGSLTTENSIFLNRFTSVKNVPCIHCNSIRSSF